MSQRWELSTGRTFIWGSLQESLKTTAQHIRSEESSRELAAALHVVECHRSPGRLLFVVPPRAFLFNTPEHIFSMRVAFLGAGRNPRTRTACAYVLQALTPGFQNLYYLWSRVNRLQFRRGLSLWLYAVVRVASGSAPSCAVPPVR